ncbi:hypothetical protein OG389_00865 [Streptomyces sp. NBC_00435]|uniref:hypothetical protein n=1 Tax=Streptomyces sp. NBC_00435 TaxID=2903649 RepID=UPI002E1D9CA4
MQLTADERGRAEAYTELARGLLLRPDDPASDGMAGNALGVLRAEAAVREWYARKAARGTAGGAAPTTKYVHRVQDPMSPGLSAVYEAYGASEMASTMGEGAWTALGASLLLLGGHAPAGTRDLICRYMCGVVCDDYAPEARRTSAGEGRRREAEAHTRKEAVAETLRSVGELWSRRLILNGNMVKARSLLIRPADATLADYATSLVHLRAGRTLDALVCARVADFGTDAYMEINPRTASRYPAGYLDDLSLCGCMAHDIVDMATDEREMEVLNIAAHTETTPTADSGLSGRFVADVLVAAPTVAAAGDPGADDAVRVPYGVIAWMFGTGRYRAWERVMEVDGLAPPSGTASPMFLTALHAECAAVIEAATSSVPYADAVVALLTLGEITAEHTGGITTWRQAAKALLERAGRIGAIASCTETLAHTRELSSLIVGQGSPAELAAKTRAMLGTVMAADLAGHEVQDAYRALCLPLVAAFVLGGLCDTAAAGRRLREGTGQAARTC